MLHFSDGVNCEIGIDIYTLICIKQITNKNLLYKEINKIKIKYAAFLCNNSELSEKEISKTIPFTLAPKLIKYLRINVTNDGKDVYTEN